MKTNNNQTYKEGYQSCVEIKQINFHDKILTGSGKISNYLRINQDLDQILIGEEIQVLGESIADTEIKKVDGSPNNCRGYFSIK